MQEPVKDRQGEMGEPGSTPGLALAVWYYAKGKVLPAVPNKPVPPGAKWWTREGDAEWWVVEEKVVKTKTEKS